MISNEIKLKAFKLRKDGKSYNQIAEALDLHKSALAYWFRNVDWSKDIKDQLSERALRVSTEKLVKFVQQKKIALARTYEEARDEAVSEFYLFKNNSLFTVGVAIYWGEGSKSFKSGHIRVANTDPDMLRTFNIFLQSICRVNINKMRL